MPTTLDPFEFHALETAFDAAAEIDDDDDPATSLLEYLSSAKAEDDARPWRRSGRLVSLLAG